MPALSAAVVPAVDVQGTAEPGRAAGQVAVARAGAALTRQVQTLDDLTRLDVE